MKTFGILCLAGLAVTAVILAIYPALYYLTLWGNYWLIYP